MSTEKMIARAVEERMRDHGPTTRRDAFRLAVIEHLTPPIDRIHSPRTRDLATREVCDIADRLMNTEPCEHERYVCGQCETGGIRGYALARGTPVETVRCRTCSGDGFLTNVERNGRAYTTPCPDCSGHP